MAPKKNPPLKKLIKKRKTEKIVTVNIDLLTPDVFYQLQKALQDEGVTLIDLDEGTVVHGQINSIEIGLVHPSTPRKIKRPLGFITSSKVEYQEKRDIDAILVQFPESLTADGAYPFMFKILLDPDIDMWLDLIAKIAPQFIVKIRGRLKPTVYFSVTSLGIAGQDKENMLELLRRKLQHFSTKEPGIDAPDLFTVYNFDEEDFEEDLF